MTLRSLLFTTAAILILSTLTLADGVKVFHLSAEPLIRIGLSTNSGSITITTGDSSLVAASPDEPVSSGGYSPG